MQYFTSIVNADNFDNVYAKVKKLITAHSGPKVWVPANEMF